MFEHKQFGDGDRLYRVPEWRRKAEQEMAVDHRSLKERVESRYFIEKEEVGLKHKKSGSSLVLRDDGRIEMFSGLGAGIVIEDDKVVLFGKEIVANGASMEIHTGTNQVYMNGQREGAGPMKEKGLRERTLQEMREQGLKARGLRDED